MTKVEILNETAKAYNINTRSIIVINTRSHMVTNSFSRCAYTTPDGRKCGLGRCLTDEALVMIVKAYKNTSIGSATLNGIYGLDNLLKEDYKGHESGFWADVQRLHDNPDNWNEEGLSEKGNNELHLLLIAYA